MRKILAVGFILAMALTSQAVRWPVTADDTGAQAVGLAQPANGSLLTNLPASNLTGTAPLATIEYSYPQNGMLNAMTNTLLPPWSAQTWQYAPYLDGQLGTFGQSPTVRIGPSNQFLINSEQDGGGNGYMWMGVQAPQFGNSNFVYCVDFCSATNTTATLSIGLSATANPFSGTTKSYTSSGIGVWTHCTFTNNVGVNGGTNGVLLLFLPSNNGIVCSNAYIQWQPNNAPTNALFQTYFTRWDVDGFRVQDNGHTLYSGMTSKGYSAYSKIFVSLDTANPCVLDLWQDQFVSGIGGIVVLTNGQLYTNITVTAASGTGREYFVNLYPPPGNTEMEIVNEYQENSGATAPAFGTVVRAIFTDTSTKVKFKENPTPFTILVAGDSISEYITDAGTTILDHWSKQFRQSRGVRVILLSCGYSGMSSETNQNSVMAAVRTYHPDVFIDARIQNDYGLNLTTTNYFGFLLAHELDYVHFICPGTICLVWNGLKQTVETANSLGATLDQYRAQVTNCIITTNRPWCVLVPVSQMPNTAYYKNGLHPQAAGGMYLWKLNDRAIQTQTAQILNGPFDTGNGWAFNGYVPLNHEFPMTVLATNGFNTPYTITGSGTTGNQTINKPSGSIRIAAAGTSVTLTDSLITANSVVVGIVATVDATAKTVVAVPSAGSCVFTLNAAATGEVEIRWTVTTQ